MQLNNVTSLREMLEQLSTEQLDEMLHKELGKKPIEDHAVRLIMQILREREEDHPVETTPEIEQAWEKYQSDIALIEKDNVRTRRSGRWLLRAASVAAMLCLIVLIFPRQAEAETFWERLSRWTESIVEFFGPSENKGRIDEYEFKTDNPGIQQVYEAVVEMGVIDQVVPMWLPDGYELTEMKETSSPRRSRVYSRFTYGDSEAVLEISFLVDDKARSYHKDNTQYTMHEKNGFAFYTARNNERCIAIWTKENIECFLTIDCQEDTFKKILRSIYVMEDEK